MAFSSPVLDDFLGLLSKQEARLPNCAMYARWIRYEADSDRATQAFSIYLHYRPIALTEGGKPMIEEVINLLCASKYRVSTSLFMLFANHLVEANKPWLAVYYDQILREACRRHANGLMELCDKLAATGYVVAPDVQSWLFHAAVIDTHTELKTLRTLYTNICAAERIILQRLAMMGDYDRVEAFYQKCNSLVGRNAYTDNGYATMLLRRNKYEQLCKLVDKVFAYSFQKLPDGRLVSAKGERVIYKDPVVMKMLDVGTDVDTQATGGEASKDTAAPPMSTDLVASSTGVLHCWPFIGLTRLQIDVCRKQSKYQTAMDAYQRFRSAGFVDLNVCEAAFWSMLDADDYSGMMSVMSDLEQTDLPLSTVIAQALIEIHLRRNDLDGAERILNAHLAVRTRTLRYDAEMGRPSTAILFGQLITRHATDGRMDKAKELFEQGCTIPDISKAEVASGLFVACNLRQSVEEMLAIAAYVQERGCQMDSGNYGTMIYLFAKKGEYNLAHDWYARAMADGIKMDAFLFANMLQVYSYAGRGAKMTAFYQRVRREDNVLIDHAILSVLCDSAGHNMGVRELEGFWKDALDDGLQPNENNYASLIEAYWRLNELDKAATALLKDMPRAGFAPNYYMLLAVQRLASKHARKDILRPVQKALANHKSSPNHDGKSS
ncbi:hypothetical protein THASP1DRAFT_24903 [Thamnocephalis sphaerospora]|uniref:Pentacotripeptide-repeat region of PRORP domain-containing protein n=1 Tax=Thamnocephalis sphaerospora TaxID=78915 RepID=A0A4V1IWA2_9FUNG|nr:hypothetical protein THASP1DRAFT_24903 [Thamnocephalis sphaerospora]|eukprot:RKP06849.1 hypothetical protein THASP1DRAFT_24903 [Thamnocephalis sphaerospora]